VVATKRQTRHVFRRHRTNLLHCSRKHACCCNRVLVFCCANMVKDWILRAPRESEYVPGFASGLCVRAHSCASRLHVIGCMRPSHTRSGGRPSCLSLRLTTEKPKRGHAFRCNRRRSRRKSDRGGFLYFGNSGKLPW